MTITLEELEAKQVEFAKLMADFKEQANRDVVYTFPQFNVTLRPGDRYAGAVISEFGNVLHHVVLMAERPTGKITWQAAKDWAASVGGALPTRQEQALLYTNCKPHLQPVWHWSCEEHSTSYAWCCFFNDGYQGYGHESYVGSVVAVRRIGANHG